MRECASQCERCNLICLLEREAGSCKFPDWFWHHTLTDGIVLLPCTCFHAGVRLNPGLNLLNLTLFVLEFNRLYFWGQRFCGACQSEPSQLKIDNIIPYGTRCYNCILTNVKRALVTTTADVIRQAKSYRARRCMFIRLFRFFNLCTIFIVSGV